jgi:hypothetical protein
LNPAEVLLGARAQPQHPGALAKAGEQGRVGDRRAAELDHRRARRGEERRERVRRQGAVTIGAVVLKELGDAHPAPGLDLTIQLYEGAAQARGQGGADGGLARAAQADQGDLLSWGAQGAEQGRALFGGQSQGAGREGVVGIVPGAQAHDELGQRHTQGLGELRQAQHAEVSFAALDLHQKTRRHASALAEGLLGEATALAKVTQAAAQRREEGGPVLGEARGGHGCSIIHYVSFANLIFRIILRSTPMRG